MALDTLQRVATHGAETRHSRRVITHSWIVDDVGSDASGGGDGRVQDLSLGAVCVEFLDSVAGSADVEEFGGGAVFLWVEHVGTI